MPRRKIWDVVGESRTNPDGRRRQDILCDVEPGESAELVREVDNSHDANAVAVKIRGEAVGYLARDEAAELAPLLDSGRPYQAIVHCIRGGVPGYPSYGCQVSIAWDGGQPHPFVELDDQQLRSRRSKRGARTRRGGGAARPVSAVAGRSGCMVAVAILILPGMLLLI
jgi:hypothetical protein